MHKDIRTFNSTSSSTCLTTSFLTVRRLLFCFIFGLAIAVPAFAQLNPAAMGPKVSADLRQMVGAFATANRNWAMDLGGRRYVKALIVSSAADPDLLVLRSAVVAAGGSVYYKYISINAISVVLPADQIGAIAQRTDVESISPNRLASRTTSLLETVTGAANVRIANAQQGKLDGAKVGIAFLDSGVMETHGNFAGNNGNGKGNSRVKQSVDILKGGLPTTAGIANWAAGMNTPSAIYLGVGLTAFQQESGGRRPNNFSDPYGHGTVVASVAAGSGSWQGPDSTGIAPGADIYDVRVLDENGYGEISDVLAGIDWVIYHGRKYGIRVMNLSLAADSEESYLTDPLCRAVRSAVAAGITVVVAAGNYGKDANGQERYGSITSPGNEPSAITVGSVNTHQTARRIDETINRFSSRGPTRGGYVDGLGVRQPDNLLKPDLVAPGNKIISALSTDEYGYQLNSIVSQYPQLIVNGRRKPAKGAGLMVLSGTSIAAPVVAGAVALMLQSNPGLTPALIKAILQYTAQPVGNASLAQQGAGALNIDGAIRLASVLRPDISTAIATGAIQPGDSLLRPGQSLPAPYSVIGGARINWSRLIVAGGSHLFSGDELFRRYQPFYDPSIVWVRGLVKHYSLRYWPIQNGAKGFPYIKSVVEDDAGALTLVTPGAISATGLAGTSSLLSARGIFVPTTDLSRWLASGGGVSLRSGIVLGGGVVISEGIGLSEGVVISEGVIVSEGIVVSEGVIVSEGIVLTEGRALVAGNPIDQSALGEP